MPTIYVINGPNLNLLGLREPATYGTITLADLELHLMQRARSLGAELKCLQSNHEGALIEAIHEAAHSGADGIVINPGGYTHTSVAIRDALLAVRVPAIEVHLSNLHQREEFRQRSLTAGAALGVITGLGIDGYLAALAILLERSRRAAEARGPAPEAGG